MNPIRVNVPARIIGLLLVAILWTSIISNSTASKLACRDVETFLSLTMSGQKLATTETIHDNGLRGQAIAYFWGALLLLAITHLWVSLNRGRVWSKSLALSLVLSGELFIVAMTIRFAMVSSLQWQGCATLILPDLLTLPLLLSAALAMGGGLWILTGRMMVVLRRPQTPPPQGPDDLLRMYKPCAN